MKIAVIGSGNVGSALAGGWQNSGHQVVFGVRNPRSDKSKKALEKTSAIPLLSIQEAAAAQEIIVITTPPEAVLELIPQLGDLGSKVVIDTTNSVRSRPEGYPTAFHALKERTTCEHLVKCFNSTGFENMKDPVYRLIHPVLHDIHLDMFAAGDSAHAKQVCRELAQQLGFHDCYDFGGSDKVQLLEQFALAWINLAIMQGMGRDMAFKLIRRESQRS